jgi:hypothetical protein
MRVLALRLAFAFGVVFAAGAALFNTASAADMSLHEVLQSKAVGAACGSNDRLLATFNFVKVQLAKPDRCLVYRFVEKDDAQRSCLGAIVSAAGQGAFLSSLGIPEAAGAPQPAFCSQGCDCQHPISYRQL